MTSRHHLAWLRNVMLWKILVLCLLAAVAAAGLAGARAKAPRSAPAQPIFQTTTPIEADKPVALFIGDSYTHGTGASDQAHRWSSLVSAELGWQEVNGAHGGTGYVTTSSLAGCGQESCPAYLGALEANAKVNADVVVIAGGQNDFSQWRSGEDEVTTAIELVYATARKMFPDTEIVTVGPSAPGAVDMTVAGMDTAVQNAAEATYVSRIDPPVITPDIFLDDRAHVDDTGHVAIADRVASTIGAP